MITLEKKKVTKWITRRMVLKALRTEPLAHGRFWHEDNQNLSLAVKPSCRVCAVGAVLRQASFEKSFLDYPQMNIGQEATRDKFVSGDINALLKEKNYLGALSSYFENFDTRNGFYKDATKVTRKKCISFVKRKFPSKFRLTISV